MSRREQMSKRQLNIWRSRLVGRGRTTGNRVTVKSGSRVRISPSPPAIKPLKMLIYSMFSRVFCVLEVLRKVRKGADFCVFLSQFCGQNVVNFSVCFLGKSSNLKPHRRRTFFGSRCIDPSWSKAACVREFLGRF